MQSNFPVRHEHLLLHFFSRKVAKRIQSSNGTDKSICLCYSERRDSLLSYHLKLDFNEQLEDCFVERPELEPCLS